MKAIQPLKLLWRRASRHWQTFVLIAGVVVGYLLLLVATSFRWLGWLLGGAIAVAMLVVWFRQFRARGEGDTSPENRTP
jgi:hypothetical protein